MTKDWKDWYDDWLKTVDKDQLAKHWEWYKKLWDEEKYKSLQSPLPQAPPKVPPLTATEVVQRQKEMERFFEKPEAVIREAAQRSIQAQVEAMKEKLVQQEELQEKSRRVSEIVDSTLKDNPTMNSDTVALARAILNAYPKMDNGNAIDLIIPFVFAIAREIQDILEERIPKEWK